MDLNELLFRHQIALIRAASPGEEGLRRRYTRHADRIAGHIRALQQRLRAHGALLNAAPAR